MYSEICIYSLVNDFCGKDRNLKVYGKSRNGGNMVCVVVGSEYCAYLFLIHPVFREIFLDFAVANACIYQNDFF